MAFTKTIVSAVTHHTLFVREIDRLSLPAKVIESEHSKAFTKFYEVRNWDKAGVVFLYLAKGAANASNEICAFYKNGQFWSSYGDNLKSAIEGAQKDGWLYTE
jgi:hypothetical protein